MKPAPCSVSAVLVFAAVVGFAAALHAAELHSYARVNEDGSLRVGNTLVHLYGIHIPGTGRSCQTYRSPPVCGSRAALALNFIIQGFVRCEIVGHDDYGDKIGWCRVDTTGHQPGTDLSAYLLEKGWAVALPIAGVEYKTLEDIARARGLGIWGTPADAVNGSSQR
jgi:endonuclease YncB( thermonuclease family)